jgi:hypothetical protein
MAAYRWSVVVFAWLFCLHSALYAQYRESRDPLRLPEPWAAKETMERDHGVIALRNSLLEKGWDLLEEKRAEKQIRDSDTLARQFESGKRVVVFRVPRTDTPSSTLDDSFVNQRDPVYIGSGDSFEEVHDEYVLDYERPIPVLRNANGPPKPFETIDSNQLDWNRPGGFYFIVTRNGEGGFILEKRYVYGDPYPAAEARKQVREKVKQFGDPFNQLHRFSDDFFFDRLARQLAKQRAERLRDATRREEEDRHRSERETTTHRERFGGFMDRETRGSGRPLAERPRGEAPNGSDEKERREWQDAKNAPSIPLGPRDDPQGQSVRQP